MIHGSTSSIWRRAIGMNDKDAIESIGSASRFLRLDFTAQEMGTYAIDHELNPESVQDIALLFQYLGKKKQQSIIEMMLRLSRLPLKEPKTFDNFDFDRFHGRQADELYDLQTLSALQARRNLAFIGPQGVGKTHLAMAFGRKCCQEGYKTYFLKASELNQKLLDARKYGHESRVINTMVKPSCLIIDEVGYCNFDKENTRMFFDIVDRRYSKDAPNTMIITSNMEPDKWVTFFSDEPALKCAMDRFFDNALLISMKGQSYRGRSRRKIEVTTGESSPALTTTQKQDSR